MPDSRRIGHCFPRGLIGHAIQNNGVIPKEYVANFTNAALLMIVKKNFKLADDGVFFRPDASRREMRSVSSWNYDEGGNMTGTAAAAIAAGDGPATNQTAAKAAPGTATAMATGSGTRQWQPRRSTKGVSGAAPGPSLPPETAYDLSLEHLSLYLSS